MAAVIYLAINTAVSFEQRPRLALYSLVPRPLPVFNDTRKKREGLVREVTCTSFRWKGGTWWKGDLFACSACSTCSAHSAGHRYSHRSSSSDSRSSVILLHVQVYGFSSPVHLRCRVRACLSLREAIGL